MILADTGFWLALANAGDRHHARARAALAKHAGPYLTTWPVMTETCHMLASRLGAHAAIAFVRSAALGAFDVFELDQSHLPRVEALVEKYRSLPIHMADASLVIAAEESGVRGHPLDGCTRLRRVSVEEPEAVQERAARVRTHSTVHESGPTARCTPSTRSPSSFTSWPRAPGLAG